MLVNIFSGEIPPFKLTSSFLGHSVSWSLTHFLLLPLSCTLLLFLNTPPSLLRPFLLTPFLTHSTPLPPFVLTSSFLARSSFFALSSFLVHSFLLLTSSFLANYLISCSIFSCLFPAFFLPFFFARLYF
jgi:hypothetical protein